MRITYSNGKFFLRGLSERGTHPAIEDLIESGWKKNKLDGWFTTSLTSASLLREHADERAEKILNRAFIQFSPWKGTLTLPKKLTLLDHQPGSVRFALNRSRSYLALAPGLGKTIVAAIIAASLGERVVYVCPPHLLFNTLEEFQKWAPSLFTKILGNDDYIIPDVLIVPDSLVARKDVMEYIRAFRPKVFIGDEWHRFKTETAQRSRALYGYRDNRKTPPYQRGILDISSIERVILMSGTPMPNRPIELYTVLKKCAGEFIDFCSLHQFGMNYCSAFKVHNPHTGDFYGYDYTGCNEREFKKLTKKFRTKNPDNMTAFMLRLNKSILGLPKLSEDVVYLSDDMPVTLRKADRDMVKKYSPKDLIKFTIKKAMGKASDDEEVHLMTYRRLLGEYKLKSAVKYIKGILESTDESLFIVAIHIDVIALLEEALKAYTPIVVTGKTPMKKRHELVKCFQRDELQRVFIGNIDAMGTGHTLTKAHRVVLVEFEWSPGENRQVIDRVHRYTLEHEVQADYLCFRNSLDAHTMITLLDKEKITSYV